MSGIISSFINAAANLGLTSMTNAANEQAATTAYNRSIEQWNRENAYNSPTAQMERLRQAGLNPNLVYGGGATTLSAHSPSVPVAKVEGHKPIDFDLLGMLQTAQSMRIAKDVSDAGISKTMAEILNLQQQNANLKSQDEVNRANAAYLAQQQLKSMAELKNLNLDFKQKQLNNDLMESSMSFRKKYFELQNMEMQEKINNLKLQSNNLKLQSKGLGYQNATDKFNLERLQTYGVSPNAPWYVSTGANVIKNAEPGIKRTGRTMYNLITSKPGVNETLLYYFWKELFNF